MADIVKMIWSQDDEDYGTYRASVESSGTSDPVMMIYNAAITTVAVYPTGRCKVQHTLGTPAEIANDTAEWIDWAMGRVRENSSDTIIGAVTAVRAVALSGSVKMEVISR